MSDFSEILNIIKETSMNVVDDDKMTKVFIGKVTSASPLTIFIDQKFVLTEKFLILSRNVTNHTVSLDYKHYTTVDGEHPHSHEYSGIESFTVLNALCAGELVYLISLFGGQKYLVADRVKQ